MRRSLTKILFILAMLPFALLFMAADDCGSEPDQVKEAINSRRDAFDRAERLHPIPQNSNFPMREALIKFTERQDLVGHPWYVYILGLNGNVIGYYVAQTYPQSTCNFLSATEDIVYNSSGNVVLTAPSLDGIFYGGGGASASCDAVFFFDAATDAMVVIGDMSFFATDQPLLLDAEPIQVRD